ncbi:hypothetical protein UQ24_04485, partial [Escherichia coli]
MKIIRCTVCVKSGVRCSGKVTDYPSTLWHVPSTVRGFPVLPRVNTTALPAPRTPLPPHTATHLQS